MKLPTGLQIQLKKGDPEYLKGRLIAYVRIEGTGEEGGSPLSGDGESPEMGANPLSAMVRNGILAVQANYVDQRNIRDFFREEFGISLEKGIQEVIDQAKHTGGLEGALDPDAVKERLESMKNADFIPIPAKIAYFSSEEEMSATDADIYFLGVFTIISHAHLCVNSFPIMYQAYFREQEHRAVELEIATLLETIENPKSSTPSEGEGEGVKIQDFEGDIQDHLLKDLIPRMIYSRGNDEEHGAALSQFKYFMSDFGYPDDTREIIELVETLHENPGRLRKLELMVAKIEALQNEDYEKLEVIKKELGQQGG